LSVLQEADRRMPYTVAWVDTLQGGARLGRSVILSGDHATDPANQSAGQTRRHRWQIPLVAPNWLLNRSSIRVFNESYWLKNSPRKEYICGIDEFFFPLDRIGGWNRLYGRRGFTQFQCVIPAVDAERGLRSLLETLLRAGQPSFLAVLKRFGVEGHGLLSFPREGWTLALDLPITGSFSAVARGLERTVLDFGGRIYFAKDAFATPDAVSVMYPRLLEFREVQARFDPAGLMQSTLSRRLRLTR